MGKVICVEGYKAFRGVMHISVYNQINAVYGEWLYKPDCKCWYCNGVSYPEYVCTIWEVE